MRFRRASRAVVVLVVTSVDLAILWYLVERAGTEPAELGPREVVPLECALATPPAAPTRPAALRGDPLAPYLDGQTGRAA